MAGDSPLWRHVFDHVERRVGTPLAAVTSSSEFHAATLRVRDLRRSIAKPVQAVVGAGLHLAGLPSNSEVRRLRRELHEVQRELSAMRREQLEKPPAGPS